MPSASPDDPLLFVLDLFDRLGIPYMIGGSLASSIHGEPRATNDFDVVASVELTHVESLRSRLEPDFYVSEDAMVDAIRRRSSFNVIHRSAVKIDIFVTGDRDWDRLALSRRVLVGYPGYPDRKVFVRSAEDIVLKKLEWFRIGGEVSERQWRDVIGVLRLRGGELDDAYLETWSAKLGIQDLLTSARHEAALVTR